MLISEREAARLLAEIGLARAQAARVLRSGLAGECIRTRHAHLYDNEAVRALVARPRVDKRRLRAEFPHGVLVVRHGETTAAGLGAGWRLAPWTRLELRIRIEQHGMLPYLETVGGFVCRGGDAVAATSDRDGRTHFQLDEPGEWFEQASGRRFPTGPGPALLHWRPRSPVETTNHRLT